MPKHILPPNPRGHNLPSKQAASYKIRKHIVKILTFWIFIPPLRKQIQRNLRYWFGIDLKPESFAERHRYRQAQRKSLQHFAHTDLFSYHIVSLGCDCFCRTIPTLWGLKPRKNQGELGYPFDLSNNALPGILKNFAKIFQNILPICTLTENIGIFRKVTLSSVMKTTADKMTTTKSANVLPAVSKTFKT